MKKFLQIFSVLLLASFSVVAVGVIKPQQASAAKPSKMAEGIQCEWQTTSKVKCSENVLQGKGFSNEKEYFLAMQSSASAGHLVFAPQEKSGVSDSITEKEYGFVHFGTNGSFKNATITQSNTDKSNGTIITDFTSDGIAIKLDTEDANRPNVCSLSNLVVGCINGYKVPYSDSNKSQATKEQVEKVKASYKDNLAAAGLDECRDEAGPLGFFLCPLNDMINGILTWALDIFTQLLTVPPLASNNTALIGAVGSIRNIVNVFYGLIFLIIIFANFIAIPGLDNYSVKKLLPKLIAVIIITQFSYLICSVMVDIGNIAGQTIPAAIATSFDPAVQGDVNKWIASDLFNPLKGIIQTIKEPSVANAGATALSGVSLFSFGFIISFVAAAMITISLFYLMVRWFGIMVLTIFAPIAFAAWVLPNTEKFAKMWATAFVKLTLMYVLVMSMLVSATIIKTILSDSATSSAIGPFVAIFIPLIAVALVPKCLKASSSMLTAAGKMASESRAGKAASGAAKGAVKKSGQEGKLAELKGKGFGTAGSGLSKLTGGRAGLGMEAKGEQLKKAPDKARSEKIGALSTDRQLELANMKDGGKNSQAAKSSLNQKLSDLSNKRNLTGGEYETLGKISGEDGKPNPIFNENITKTTPGVFTNPIYNSVDTAPVITSGGGGNGGGGSSTPPVNTPPVSTSPKPPPNRKSGDARTSGWNEPSPTGKPPL